MSSQRYDAFLKVAEAGSFKEAARELGYTQAGVSYLVNAFEKELGLTLFVRDYGGVHLSADGADLLPRVQDIANAERQLTSRVAELKHLEGGLVRVATFTSTAIQWLPHIAKQFEESHPGIDLDILCCDDQSELEDMVWRGDVDCGFVVLPTKYDFHTLALTRDPLVVVVAKDHPHAHDTHFPTELLASEPYIKLESGIYSEMDELFRRNKVEPKIRFTIDSDYAVMSLASAGLGYSVLPSLILHNAPFPLASLPPEVPTEREIAVCIRSEDSVSTATKAFLETTQTWVQREYSEQV